MQQKFLKKMKVFSVVFILVSALGIASLAQAGFKSYRGGFNAKFGHKGSFSNNFKYKSSYSNRYRSGFRGKTSGFKNYYKPRNRSFSSSRSFSSNRSFSSRSGKYYNNHFPYRNYAFRSSNGFHNKGFSSKRVIVPSFRKKHATTVVIAGAGVGAAGQVNNSNPDQTQSNNKVACYNYRLSSVGGVGGFRFNGSDSAIKVANDSTITGEFCGSKFVEFELAKIDSNVAIDFELAGNVFEFPVNADAVQQDGWQKKFFSVDLKPAN